eukprot:TRINITY_DN31529_c0_g1_i1.p1 TRINITY_DN31529_c0_g1~~TRINITY_DN31529_c0_g1_i1.p1  ORF type:complete len:729 (-),score=102.76 TRINITY_DN31529_c0_g1_i1:58-2244(-)
MEGVSPKRHSLCSDGAYSDLDRVLVQTEETVRRCIEDAFRDELATRLDQHLEHFEVLASLMGGHQEQVQQIFSCLAELVSKGISMDQPQPSKPMESWPSGSWPPPAPDVKIVRTPSCASGPVPLDDDASEVEQVPEDARTASTDECGEWVTRAVSRPSMAMTTTSTGGRKSVSAALREGPDTPRNRANRANGDADNPARTKTFAEQEAERRRLAVNEVVEEVSNNSEVAKIPPWRRLHGKIAGMVASTTFDYVFAVLIMLNAVFIGLQVDMPDQAESLSSVQLFFTFAFLIEVILRVTAAGRRFFTDEARVWNLVDTTIVLLSIFELLSDLFLDQNKHNVSVIRLARFMRIVKFVRIIRLTRFFRSLRILVQSIFATLKSLVWAMFLLCMIMYLWGVIFTQAVTDYLVQGRAETEEDEAILQTHFGTIFQTVLTLFMTLTGGMDWGDVIPSLLNVSIVYVCMYLAYVVFGSFAVLNVVTGVFCQAAIESAEQDQEEVIEIQLQSMNTYTERLTKLFKEIDANSSGYITLRDFEKYMQDSRVQAYFHALDLRIHEAWSLFKLIDKECAHVISIADFVDGCLRMRGNAKSLEVNEMMYQNRWMMDKLADFVEEFEELIPVLMKQEGYDRIQGYEKRSDDQETAVPTSSVPLRSSALVRKSQLSRWGTQDFDDIANVTTGSAALGQKVPRTTRRARNGARTWYDLGEDQEDVHQPAVESYHSYDSMTSRGN